MPWRPGCGSVVLCCAAGRTVGWYLTRWQASGVMYAGKQYVLTSQYYLTLQYAIDTMKTMSRRILTSMYFQGRPAESSRRPTRTPHE